MSEVAALDDRQANSSASVTSALFSATTVGDRHPIASRSSAGAREAPKTIDNASKAVARTVQELTKRDFIFAYSTDRQHCVDSQGGREGNHRLAPVSALFAHHETRQLMKDRKSVV